MLVDVAGATVLVSADLDTVVTTFSSSKASRVLLGIPSARAIDDAVSAAHATQYLGLGPNEPAKALSWRTSQLERRRGDGFTRTPSSASELRLENRRVGGVLG
jgi:hypothetical protein